jgi:hypothetical protein
MATLVMLLLVMVPGSLSTLPSTQETRIHIESDFHLRRCLAGYVAQMKEAKRHGERAEGEYFPDISESLVQLMEYRDFKKVSRPVMFGIGLGTTATRGVTMDWVAANVTAIHYHNCHGIRCEECQHEVPRWKFYEFSKTFSGLYKFLYEVFSFGCIEAFADSPVPHLLPHIFRVAPNARFFYTVREPEEWWDRRKRHYGADVLFNVNGKQTMAEAIETRWKINPKDGVTFYKAYDTLVRCMFEHTQYLELNYFTNTSIFHNRDGSTRTLTGSVSENVMKYATENDLWEEVGSRDQGARG